MSNIYIIHCVCGCGIDPSVVWWSVCNEIGCTQLTGDATIAAGVKFKQILYRLQTFRVQLMRELGVNAW